MIVPFSSSGDPGCFTGLLSDPADGQIVTVVIARGLGICQHPGSTCMGVVFYGAKAMMWTCLSDAELSAFQSWSGQNFAGARVLSVSAVSSNVVCPPPTLNAEEHAHSLGKIQSTLTELGTGWLAHAAA